MSLQFNLFMRATGASGDIIVFDNSADVNHSVVAFAPSMIDNINGVAGRTVTVPLSGPLLAGRSYTATFPSGVVETYTSNSYGGLVWSFATNNGPEPKILSTSPNGALGWPYSGTSQSIELVLTFDEDMKVRCSLPFARCSRRPPLTLLSLAGKLRQHPGL